MAKHVCEHGVRFVITPHKVEWTINEHIMELSFKNGERESPVGIAAMHIQGNVAPIFKQLGSLQGLTKVTVKVLPSHFATMAKLRPTSAQDI